MREVPCCPHCSRPLQPLRYGVAFGPLAIRIIDAIEQAGGDGINTIDLFDKVYRDRKGATVHRLKTYIGTINELLAPQGLAIRVDRHSARVTMGRRLS